MDSLLSSINNIGSALTVLFPNADPLSDYCVVNENDEFHLTSWNLADPIPTEADIISALSTYDDLSYKHKRRDEYPPIGDQLDAIWKFLNPPEGTPAYDMKQIVDAVKAKYPKP